MYKLLGSFAVASLASGAIASPADPAITASPSLSKRADSCTFSGEDGAASASASQASCATITLSDVAVPSGTTLDLSDLEDDTTVIPVYSLLFVSSSNPDRSSSRAPPPGATRNGKARCSKSRATASPSREPPAQS